MRAHKYLDYFKSPPYGVQGPAKQNVAGMELTRLLVGDLTIPVVATAERERLSLAWWNPTAGQWMVSGRNHDPMEARGQVWYQATHWNWSRQFGLTSGDEAVYLVYKRKLVNVGAPGDSRLLLEKYVWRSNTSELDRVTEPDPIEIPLGELGYDRAGFHVWAGYDADQGRLILLLQAVVAEETPLTHVELPPDLGLPYDEPKYFDPDLAGYGVAREDLLERGHRTGTTSTAIPRDVEVLERCELILLSARVTDSSADLSVAGNWTLQKIDDGGYDLDVLHKGGILHLLYRRGPYAVTVQTNVPEGSSAEVVVPLEGDTADDSQYAPIRFRAIDLATDGIAASEDDLPGGFNPQIQSLTPFFYTADRVGEGQCRIRPHQEVSNPIYAGQTSAIGPIVRVEVNQLQKILVRRHNSSWYRGRITKYRSSIVPRSFADLYGKEDTLLRLMPKEFEKTAGPDYCRFTLLQTYQPAFVIGWSRRLVPEEHRVEELLDFILHEPWMGSLNIVRVSIDPDRPDLGPPQREGTAVFDINHEQIPAHVLPEGLAEESPENGQFCPVQFGQHVFDNTMGGCLQLDRGSNGLSFLAYTDLGDGGGRIIFDEELPDPEPIPIPDTKGLEPVSVPGPGSGPDQWIDIGTDSWTDTHLPAYSVARDLSLEAAMSMLGVVANPAAGESLGSGIHSRLDSLLYFLQNQGVLPNSAGAYEVTPGIAAEIDALIATLNPEHGSLWDLLWSPFDRMNQQGASGVVEWEIQEATYEVDAYELIFKSNENGARGKIVISPLGERHAQYVFLEQPTRQGRVGFRFPIEFVSREIKVKGVLAAMISIKWIVARFFYGREFTPAILMSEQRRRHPLTEATLDPPIELITEVSSGLSAKPASRTTLGLSSVSSEVRVSVWGISTLMVISLLFALGLDALASAISVAYVASKSGMWFIALAALGILFSLLATVPAAVRGVVRSQINEQFAGLNLREAFDEMRLLSYAGEGIGEVLARRIIEHPALPNLDLDPGNTSGRNRYWDQFWQMIHIYAGRARILVRPPA